jgi:hypothetical protein
MPNKPNSASGSATASAPAPDKSVEFVLSHADTADKFCTALAKLFGVRLTEVAVLRLEHGFLKFILPEQLKTAGSIPVSSSSAVAAHTAATKKTELFNTFAKVKHARVFETVKLTNEDSDRSEQAAIQKLMSAPILDGERKVLGVIQVCRKGFDLNTAGPDFTLDDLQQLEVATKVASTLAFIKSASAEKK